MLQKLSIHNYVLIKELEISFHEGFSVLTGETGAGKSIILGAINLLMGQRADPKMISEGEQRCVIEAEFNIEGLNLEPLFTSLDLDYDGPSCIIRRELTAAGKSRAFINDSPVALASLREVGDRLIDIHSQHKNLLLTKEDFQLQVLDTIANDSALLSNYSQAHERYRQAAHKLAAAKETLAKAKADEDYLRFQLQQLTELNLESGKQAEMEQEQQMLEHAEEIKEALWHASSALQGDGNVSEGAISALRNASRQLQAISSMMPAATELSERLESQLIELRDIASTAESEGEAIDVNPSRLTAVEEWLSALYSAMKKFHVDDEDALIGLRDQFREQLGAIENSDEHINKYTRECEEAHAALIAIGRQLTQERQQAAKVVEQQMHDRLAPLGIPNVQFQVSITELPEPSESGLNQVTFLFSGNQGSPLRPLSEVASGGEIARVMLSLKALLSGARGLPTIIFDEIDTGVSGHIAERMAQMMLEMGREGRQVISITHLPQIAAVGQHHYRVYKTESNAATESHIMELTADERITEIAHMLSGAQLTQAAIDNAKALLKAK